ncbi:hypothetical protein A4X13_0g6562 [Tilletia indica]|uniref:Importin subunit beta-1/Transportin-1-like TPR repeats domain-containing protein n=1 Tax=Tilletia indica TaxID=43049 RepID=A0A8T8SPN6_9BASI|nr:hypothetical protein A4X13_0g6562 [Tilletia indica]
MNLLLTPNQNADDDEWEVFKAAATCIGRMAACVGDATIMPAIPFMEGGIKSVPERARGYMHVRRLHHGRSHRRNTHPSRRPGSPRRYLFPPRPPHPRQEHRRLDSRERSQGRASNRDQLLLDDYECLETAWEEENSPPTSTVSPLYEGILNTLLPATDLSDNASNCRMAAHEGLDTAVSNAMSNTPTDCLRHVSNVLLQVLRQQEHPNGLVNQLINYRRPEQLDPRARFSKPTYPNLPLPARLRQTRTAKTKSRYPSLSIVTRSSIVAERTSKTNCARLKGVDVNDLFSSQPVPSSQSQSGAAAPPSSQLDAFQQEVTPSSAQPTVSATSSGTRKRNRSSTRQEEALSQLPANVSQWALDKGLNESCILDLAEFNEMHFENLDRNMVQTTEQMRLAIGRLEISVEELKKSNAELVTISSEERNAIHRIVGQIFFCADVQGYSKDSTISNVILMYKERKPSQMGSAFASLMSENDPSFKQLVASMIKRELSTLRAHVRDRFQASLGLDAKGTKLNLYGLYVSLTKPYNIPVVKKERHTSCLSSEPRSSVKSANQ